MKLLNEFKSLFDVPTRFERKQQKSSNFIARLKQLKKPLIMKKIVIMAIAIAAMFVCSLTSCNVTRKVTTEAVYHQNGDTAVQIITKTTEVYDASKK